MEQEILATITIELPNGTREITKRFILTKSSAFQYGNGTCVLVECDNGLDEYVDTRYDIGITKNFMAWVLDYLTAQYDPRLHPQFGLQKIK